jgi:hypothetical protein
LHCLDGRFTVSLRFDTFVVLGFPGTGQTLRLRGCLEVGHLQFRSGTGQGFLVGTQPGNQIFSSTYGCLLLGELE